MRILTGVYNFGIRKIELNARNNVFFSKKQFNNLCAGHSTRLGVPSHVIQAALMQAYAAWGRCFRKQSRKPRLKSVRNKLRIITFPDLFNRNRINGGKITLPIVGKIRYFKQQIPHGQIKNCRIIRRASGWYCQLVIDTVRVFEVKHTYKKVGIDTGFKTLASLSDGTKICNKREFVKWQNRLAQSQRGRNKKLTARIHERIGNRRRDYNHKMSRKIVENHAEIYVTKDNLRKQSKIFGKSIGDAGIAQLRNFILYKGDIHGRVVKLVDSRNTTRTCSKCGDTTGPRGRSGLTVRVWECSSCGATHDRDINAAVNILKLGSGYDLVNLKPFH